ncbi:hypothetical protein [uncultured Aquimarina sp.]|uniref:hypothetical protein n=1 Tax=uncultured Aquimarina sp. TaxID=575652 RepID=UPI002613B78B|nr:hypothetical protein [uncultured Aquimarina sp.]
MDQKIVEKVVREMFEKAKNGSVSHSKYALSKYISEETDNCIKTKTAERAYEKYILGRKRGNPQGESVDNFCNYLGYKNYKEYVEKNKVPVNRGGTIVDTPPSEPPINGYVKITIGTVISIFLIVFINSQIKKGDNKINANSKCMAWVENSYKEISCDLEFHPDSGAKTEPYDAKRLKNFTKVEVTASYDFFVGNNTKKPRIWYYKNSNDEIEYFTSSGIHPTNGETLKKITPHIIDTYVPKHIFKPDSFIDTNTENKQ